MEWKVPLGSAHVLREDLDPVIEAYLSGWLSTGPRTEELEAAFSDYVGAGHCLAVSSGSAALHLACLACNLGPGDRVVLPSLTFVATANAIAYCGAEPAFAEISSLSQPWLSAEAAEEAIDERTRAIIAVCYGGHPGEIVRLRELAREKGLILIEDAAHGCGTWVEGHHAGTVGTVGAFSFSAAKSVGVGEGGMVATDDAELAERVGLLRWHGISRSSWSRHGDVAASYDVGPLGFNYRLDDPRAALALARLRRLEEEIEWRARIDSAYRRDLEGLEGIRPTEQAAPGSRSSRMMFTAVLDESVDRDRFRRDLAARGVQTSVHFPPVHTLSLYRDGRTRLPLTEAYGERAVSLPIFFGMEEWQRELVVEAVIEALTSSANGYRSTRGARAANGRQASRTR